MLDGNARLGGPSRRVGGRDERPPQSSSPTAGAAATAAAANPPSTKRWIPPSVVNKSICHSTSERNDVVFRKVRGILNKLTPEKFDKLSLELLNVGIDNQTILKGIILLIFEKALDEPKYSSLYAQLCHRLFKDAPNFEPPDSNVTTFRRLLLSKCQDEFENRSRATEAYDKDGPLTPEEAEQCGIAKAKMLGNIKFIGELGKLEMVQEGILHKCIKQLIERKKTPTGSTTRVADMAEDMECLCEILRTVGRRLDHERARLWMDKYFERIRIYQADTELPSRIRFMLQDVIELRANGWQPRKLALSQGAPKTIQQVREDVAKESGVYIPKPPMLSPSYFMTDPFFGPAMSSRGMLNGLQSADMFSSLPPMYMSGIGTGPGVIHVDNFTKNSQLNGGRQRGIDRGNFDGVSTGGGRRTDGSNAKGDRYRDQNEGNDARTKHQSQDSDSGSERMVRLGGSANSGKQVPHNGDDFSGRHEHDGNRSRSERHNDKHTAKQSAQQGTRELPPRFQRKQQQQQQLQQKDSAFLATDVGHSQLAPNVAAVPPSSDPSLFPVSYHPGAPDIGSYAPMIPAVPHGIGVGQGPVASGGHRANASSSSEDVSLRPARNFTPLLKPNTPAALPKSAQSAHPQQNARIMPAAPVANLVNITQPVGPLVQKQITVIQVPTLDKNKDRANKSTGETNRDQLKQSVETLLNTLLENGIIEDAVNTVTKMKPPKKLLPELLSYMMLQTMDKSDDDRDLVSSFVTALKENGTINADNYMEALKTVLDNMHSLEQTNPLAKSYVAKFAAGAIAGGLISIADLALPLEGGFLYPLFLLCLQQLVKIKDRDWLSKAFHESKVNLQNMLPEMDHSKDCMIEILEDRGLSFLFPLLRIQNELWKQLNTDPNPQAFFKWLRDNVDSKLHTDDGFITILVTAIVRYVTGETTLRDADDVGTAPEKMLVDKEKELLEKYKGVLQKFLLDKIPLHVTAIYALQTFSYNNRNPKGLLLRMFMNMYNFEILDEEAFIKWKEEVNDLHPGKGQALFQVNHWLTWLEQAEEESDDEN